MGVCGVHDAVFGDVLLDGWSGDGMGGGFYRVRIWGGGVSGGRVRALCLLGSLKTRCFEF